METNPMSNSKWTACPRCGQARPVTTGGTPSSTLAARCERCGEAGFPISHAASGSSRRAFLSTLALGTAAFAARGTFAEEAARRTAWVEEGPFYPYNRLPLDTDNDLLIVNDALTPASGAITHLSGRLLDAKGEPVKNAVIEIWQVDNNSVYFRERGQGSNFDPNFQGFGRFLTGSTGEYYFRTIKPVPYRGRPAAHIHFKVKAARQREWTTQLYIKGFPGNARDGVYNGIGSAADQGSVTVDFVPIKESRIGELAARFDIIMGWTAQP